MTVSVTPHRCTAKVVGKVDVRSIVDELGLQHDRGPDAEVVCGIGEEVEVGRVVQHGTGEVGAVNASDILRIGALINDRCGDTGVSTSAVGNEQIHIVTSSAVEPGSSVAKACGDGTEVGSAHDWHDGIVSLSVDLDVDVGGAEASA